MTKTKLAFATALLVLSGSAALAKTHATQNSAPLVQREISAPVVGGDYPPVVGEGYYEGIREYNIDRFDHASSPY